MKFDSFAAVVAGLIRMEYPSMPDAVFASRQVDWIGKNAMLRPMPADDEHVMLLIVPSGVDIAPVTYAMSDLGAREIAIAVAKVFGSPEGDAR
jgi:hypothetical protein